MSRIAEKLSWEIVALNDRGDGSQEPYTALEVCYGVALTIGDQPDFFRTVMAAIIEQVSDKGLKRSMQFHTTRALSK